MFHKFRLPQITIALALVAMLLFGGIVLPQTAPTVYAQTKPLELRITGPTYVQAGNNITYELTVKNTSNQAQTNITFYNDLPAATTYVSGGTLVVDTVNYVTFTLPNLAANASQTVTWVAKADSGLAEGAVITNDSFNFFDENIGSSFLPDAITGVELPGTLVAVYKNRAGRPFDVTVDGYQFQNYTNEAPRNFSNDLDAEDMFLLFGERACQSGDTAATCVLSGPALTWAQKEIAGMNGGHCEGMAATSLRLFDELSFKGRATPGDYQPGASSTVDLQFPGESLENHIAYYFVTQTVDEYYNPANEIAKSPNELIEILKRDFALPEPLAYTVGIFTIDGKAGHAIAAYGVEEVNATKSRILVYDNNFPKQRQYITVNTAENTWSYVTSATPGTSDTVYNGTATSGNLSLHLNKSRELAPGQVFTCPFCPAETTSSASIQAAAAGMVAGQIDFQYTGEGAILVVNEEDQSTGFAFDTETFINEIPNAEVIPFKGGLGLDIPPRIVVPFVETDETLYSVFVSGKTIDAVAEGALSMTGEGFVMGLDAIQLNPDEFLEVVISPDGDFIAFHATETVVAPAMYISYDPVSDEDPSIIFKIDGIILDPGEESSITLDPDLERVYFDDSGALGQEFDVTMTFIWPDGDTEDYIQSIFVPEGSTSAFVDFGAWDGLLEPSYYVDDFLQNPLANHRLKLESTTGTYDPTPQANAPAGVYHVEATFSNVTEVVLNDVYFTVADLAAGNVLLNADGGPAGVGAEILVPAAALGNNGLLDANESFTIGFDVGLASAGASNLTVDANGEPWDWTPNADPAPTYDANDTSFVFAVETSAGNVLATCGDYTIIETTPGVYTAPGFAGNLIVGTNGNDRLNGTNGPDLMVGLGGNDRLSGKNGNDLICGGDGYDILKGGNHNDLLDGGNGPDDLYGENGDDTLTAGDGIDILVGGNGMDTLTGGDSLDFLAGNNENDMLDGGDHADLLYGGKGDDNLFGNDGWDALYGDKGNDALDGGAQFDYCNGGSGNDSSVNCEIKVSAADAAATLLFAQSDAIADVEEGEVDVVAIRQLLADHAEQENSLNNTIFLPLITK